MARQVTARVVDADVGPSGVRIWLWQVHDSDPGLEVRLWLSEDEAKRLVTQIIAGLRRRRRYARRQRAREASWVLELLGRWLAHVHHASAYEVDGEVAAEEAVR